ncbi:MAG: DUF177 domain-containing protein [Candidatus Omnitrophica bacterium]|nr:DUF177 domain-containing protein [Candidatus Omnitrophota bacterium]
MEIILSEITENGLDLNGSYDPVALGLNTRQVTFKSPLNVSLRAQRREDILWVTGVVKGDMNCICSRCLEEFTISMAEDFKFDYNIGNEKSIDITDDVRQEIILGFPLKVLCRPECKGLCQKCGKDFNEGECQCRTEYFGPFEKLIN